MFANGLSKKYKINYIKSGNIVNLKKSKKILGFDGGFELEIINNEIRKNEAIF